LLYLHHNKIYKNMNEGDFLSNKDVIKAIGMGVVYAVAIFAVIIGIVIIAII